MGKNRLSNEEIRRLKALYVSDPEVPIPIALNQLQYISTDHLFQLCRAYDMHFIGGTQKKNWRIERDLLGQQIHIINLVDKGFSYRLDTLNGNFNQSVNGRLLNTGCNTDVVQFYFLNKYAIKPYFKSDHWARGKSLFELGEAIPSVWALDLVLKEIYDKDLQKIQDWYADKLFHNVKLTNLEVYNDTIMNICHEHKLDLNKLL